MIQEEKTIEYLTQTTARIATSKYIEYEGVKYQIGLANRRSYVNSKTGRNEIKENLEEPFLTSVMAIWGSEPVVPEERVINHD